MILRSADAGPVGRRRSCSQFCRVFTLTPIKSANSDCERLVRSRIALTPEEAIKARRDAFAPRAELLRLLAHCPATLQTFAFSLPNSSLTTLASCETCFGVKSVAALFGYA